MSELRLDATPSLVQLLDRGALEDVCRSFHETFGVAARVVGSAGHVLSSVGQPSAHEHSLPIEYDGQRLGRLVVSRPAREPWQGPDLAALAAHLARVLDALLFSGHRAHLASTMHLAAAEQSYRELAAQNERLQHAYDKLKQLDRLKSNFLATMSHELRTPLTSIIGYSDMLATGMGGELNPTQREFVDTIRAKGDHLLELILTLLDVAKLEQDRVRLNLVSVPAGELVLDVVRTVGPTAAKKQIQVEHRLAPALPCVRADPVRLRQVLLNLLENALKFTPEGGCVSVAAEPTSLSPPASDDPSGLVLLGAPQPAVLFTVRDNGIGIPQAEHERIFDAFYQVDGSATREYGGTGLGLSIVKRLVDAHDGTITLESAPDAGTTFHVRIPVADAPSESPAA